MNGKLFRIQEETEICAMHVRLILRSEITKESCRFVQQVANVERGLKAYICHLHIVTGNWIRHVRSDVVAENLRTVQTAHARHIRDYTLLNEIDMILKKQIDDLIEAKVLMRQ